MNATSKKVAAKTAFSRQQLWRQALWGSAAAAAMLVAILSSRSDLGAPHDPTVLSSTNPASSAPLQSEQAASKAAKLSAPRSSDADAATRQLALTVLGLTEDRDRIMTRLAMVERNIDDMTGSIARQIEAAKDETARVLTPPRRDEPLVPMTTAAIASMAASGVPPPAGLSLPLPSSRSTPAAGQSPPDAVAAAPPPAFGADIGGASSLKALHALWAEIRAAHAEIFEGLSPVVTLRDNARSSRIELRLVVGPFADAGAAAQLCASLAAFRLSCQPTMFDGQHLALR